MRPSSAPRGDWSRLEELVKRLSGPARPREPELFREFWTLYRSATSRLASLQAVGKNDEEEYYLNRLVASAHAILYRRRGAGGGLRGIARFLSSGWPRVVRANGRFVGLAATTFLVGSLSGGFYSAKDPGFLGLVASPEILSSIEAREMWTDGLFSVRPAASSFIFSNNLSVAILAFALGMTAGLGTLWILFMNGASFGAVLLAVIEGGMAAEFFGFVVPHGVLELPAIFIAGASGLVLGKGMLVPGDRTRRRSIILAARVAVRLLVGCAPVLLAAAAIEAYFSPGPSPLETKLAVGAVLALGLAGYVLRRAGTRPPR